MRRRYRWHAPFLAVSSDMLARARALSGDTSPGEMKMMTLGLLHLLIQRLTTIPVSIVQLGVRSIQMIVAVSFLDPLSGSLALIFSSGACGMLDHHPVLLYPFWHHTPSTLTTIQQNTKITAFLSTLSESPNLSLPKNARIASELLQLAGSDAMRCDGAETRQDGRVGL